MRPSATGGSISVEVVPGGQCRIDRVLDPGVTEGVGQLGLPELRARREAAEAEAADGQAALEVVRVERPDLVILDLTMPRLDGLCASAALRSDPSWPGPGCWS